MNTGIYNSRNLKSCFYKLIAKEISSFSRYYDRIIQWHILKRCTGDLLKKIDCPIKEEIANDKTIPDLSKEKDKRTIILFNGVFNHCEDIQGLLLKIKPRLSRTSRLAVVMYNPYLKWLYWLANITRLRKGGLPKTFVTRTDLINISKISGYEVIFIRPAAYCPFRFLGIGALINRIFPSLPFFRFLCLVNIILLRPIIRSTDKPSLSIIIPARNEEGNIVDAIKRLPKLETQVEIVFVEGHSNDATWEKIKQVAEEFSTSYNIQTLQQKGVGKNDAVRLGFERATGDVVTILDADLTMPPELLGRFYNAYSEGIADFINGSRLVYPMEGSAMRFLNRIGNIFFAKNLSYVLETRIGDSLCGTKLLASHDYDRVDRWRRDFGELDPFGDFDLLFAAAIMGLGIVDIPVRYRARLYGATNISRFSHGWILFKMVLVGFFRVKLGRT